MNGHSKARRCLHILSRLINVFVRKENQIYRWLRQTLAVGPGGCVGCLWIARWFLDYKVLRFMPWCSVREKGAYSENVHGWAYTILCRPQGESTKGNGPPVLTSTDLSSVHGWGVLAAYEIGLLLKHMPWNRRLPFNWTINLQVNVWVWAHLPSPTLCWLGQVS